MNGMLLVWLYGKNLLAPHIILGEHAENIFFQVASADFFKRSTLIKELNLGI